MGEPLECEHPNPTNGDTLHQTTTGLAYWREASNILPFAKGWDHWAPVGGELVHWIGSSIDPPGVLLPTPTSTPTPQRVGNGVDRLEGRAMIGPLAPVERPGKPTPTPSPETCSARGIIIFTADGRT